MCKEAVFHLFFSSKLGLLRMQWVEKTIVVCLRYNVYTAQIWSMFENDTFFQNVTQCQSEMMAHVLERHATRAHMSLTMLTKDMSSHDHIIDWKEITATAFRRQVHYAGKWYISYFNCVGMPRSCLCLLLSKSMISKGMNL